MECQKLVNDLQQAQIIVTTAVSAGRPNFFKACSSFDIVLIDEASQLLVPETFIPLRFYPKVMFLVGDQEQLPPVVKSKYCREQGFEDSLCLN